MARTFGHALHASLAFVVAVNGFGHISDHFSSVRMRRTAHLRVHQPTNLLLARFVEDFRVFNLRDREGFLRVRG